MGQDESSQDQSNNSNLNDSEILDELENIPPIEPLIKKDLTNEEYIQNLRIPAGILPKTYKVVKSYFYDISYYINKNEETLSALILKQYNEYHTISKKINQRKIDTEACLTQINKLCQTIDSQIKITSESLSKTIQRANIIAEKLDSDIPSFENF